VTPLHLYLNRLLGYTDARYLHLPLIKTADGKKLSKQTGASGIDPERAQEQLIYALQFLGQRTYPGLQHESPQNILRYAIKTWDYQRIPGTKPTATA
jgi:glutamyl-Q tRNA(Asp) synthetase